MRTRFSTRFLAWDSVLSATEGAMGGAEPGLLDTRRGGAEGGDSLLLGVLLLPLVAEKASEAAATRPTELLSSSLCA